MQQLTHPSSVWDMVAARAAKCPAVGVAWPFVVVGTCVLMVQGDCGALGKAPEGAMGSASACINRVVCEGLVQNKG